jgi:hypothetical protein
MTKIDPKLPVRTRDGRPVQIITTEGRSPGLPVVGYIGDARNLTYWDADGKWRPGIAQHDRDLMQDREVWVNIYNEDFLAVFPTKEAAQRSTKTPIARVRVPYTPGQFDD